MNGRTATIDATGATSVETLIRYAAHRFDAAGIEFRPPRMSRMIRNVGITMARNAIDAYVIDRISDASWNDFELFVNGYADPTGAFAVRNLDNDNAAALIRTRHASAVTDEGRGLQRR